MSKAVTLYTLALTPNQQTGEEVIIEKHHITEEECRYYIDEGEEFENAAMLLLYENEVMEWEQRFIRCIILTPQQLEAIKGYREDEE
jgi:hypothetical protein